MRLVITGGLGHIGTGLLSKIDKLNGVKEILIIDNLSSNKLHVLFDFKSRIPIKFIESDLLSSDLTKILKTKDIIIHLAAITNAAESFKIKKKIFNNNFLTTKKIVDIANKKKLKCIFFFINKCLWFW